MAEKIIISPGDLPKVESQFGFAEGELSKARVLIHGELAERLGEVEDEASIGIKAPSGGEGSLLQIVATTNSDKIIGILNYRWNKEDHKWQIEKPDDDEMDDGLSPVLKGIGNIVAAIKELRGKK
jgi:hypothetical protein